MKRQLEDCLDNTDWDLIETRRYILSCAKQIHKDDITRCDTLCLFGSSLFPADARVMTICNTGGLCSGGIGTALGCIQYAHAFKKNVEVYVPKNGDAANKIGTYNLAVLAKHHNIPFYVAAPDSTVDRNIESGKDIPIEERAANEISSYTDKVYNPAFDVTPFELIDTIITEKGYWK